MLAETCWVLFVLCAPQTRALPSFQLHHNRSEEYLQSINHMCSHAEVVGMGRQQEGGTVGDATVFANLQGKVFV